AATATTSNAGTSTGPATSAIRIAQPPGYPTTGYATKGPEQRCGQDTPPRHGPPTDEPSRFGGSAVLGRPGRSATTQTAGRLHACLVVRPTEADGRRPEGESDDGQEKRGPDGPTRPRRGPRRCTPGHLGVIDDLAEHAGRRPRCGRRGGRQPRQQCPCCG